MQTEKTAAARKKAEAETIVPIAAIKKEKTASSPKSSRYPEGEIAAEEKDIYRSDKYSKNDERAEDD